MWINENLLEAIEEAVTNDKPVRFPEEPQPTLTVCSSPTGSAFRVERAYWVDENRNVYNVWLQIQHRRGEPFPGLYVVGTVALDGASSGNTSIIRKENRYHTII